MKISATRTRFVVVSLSDIGAVKLTINNLSIQNATDEH